MRALLWLLARAFLFRFDAETAHLLTIRLIRLGIRLGGVPLRLVSGVWGWPVSPTVRVAGIEFQGRLGLAAGLDKNAEILEGLPALGFSFAEIGTVTPRPQSGNERPRLFRDLARETLFNRMGFNNLGATMIAQRLRAARKSLPEGFRVGVNLGKNKDTPLEEAAQDYARAAAPFRGLADYLVINVSSPNTPGLRSLQTAESLRPIIAAVQAEIAAWEPRPPLFLKLAPEIEGDDLRTLLKAVENWKIDGWVLTNTLAGSFKDQIGGFSGKILTERSRRSLITAREVTSLPIVSVGGILDGDEALKRVEAGADLVQIYSGWIYRGPALPREIAKKLR
ncbi:MAG: quinone-dependent dihydroorotate dehydrogenase [Bdellovibrionota bacterium]